jgi:hypothetical protein
MKLQLSKPTVYENVTFDGVTRRCPSTDFIILDTDDIQGELDIRKYDGLCVYVPPQESTANES